jgi:hypothetical protein
MKNRRPVEAVSESVIVPPAEVTMIRLRGSVRLLADGAGAVQERVVIHAAHEHMIRHAAVFL